ncbi:hypothetical protein F-VV10_0429 [Faustovirus]|nr:hypothetical protein F-VV10_0429 [Faustovirus]
MENITLCNDVIEHNILKYTPMAFLSTNRRLNGVARAAITRAMGKLSAEYIDKITRCNPPDIYFAGWALGIFMGIVEGMGSIDEIVKSIYCYDADVCLRALVAAGYDISAYSFETAFTHRSLKCIGWISKIHSGRFAMYAYIYALRFDDVEMLTVVLDSDHIHATTGKLYSALLERKYNCYRYLLSKVIPNDDVFEYLVSQDLPQLLDETLAHNASLDFITLRLNSAEFHRFVGKSANLPTLRILIKHKFNPALWDQLVITTAASNNMSAAIALSKYIDKNINSVKLGQQLKAKK